MCVYERGKIRTTRMQLGWSPVNFHPFLSPSQCLPRFCAGCQCSSERGRAGVGSAAHAVSLETAVCVCCFSPERRNSRIQTLNHHWGLNVGSESRGHLTVIKGIFLLRAVFACPAEPPGLPQPAREVARSTEAWEFQGPPVMDWAGKWVFRWQQADAGAVLWENKDKGLYNETGIITLIHKEKYTLEYIWDPTGLTVEKKWTAMVAFVFP